MKLERIHIGFFLGVAAFTWSGLLWWSGTPFSWEHFKPFSIVVSLLVGLGVVLEKWAWAWRVFHGWFVKRPDLRGTWRITLQSSFAPKVKCPRGGCQEQLSSGKPIDPIICYMGVQQTLSGLQMHLMTPESESWFLAHRIIPSKSGKGYEVVGVYSNEPSIRLRHESRSEVHFGAIRIKTHGELERKPSKMKAEYWTDRKTKGDMDFGMRIPELCTDYEEAQGAFEKNGS